MPRSGQAVARAQAVLDVRAIGVPRPGPGRLRAVRRRPRARCSRRVSFVARDVSGVDLPDTTVYVDDVLVVTRLDDGRPHDVDPGNHTVRFPTAARRSRSSTVVIGSGEQGRTVAATFGSPQTPSAPAAASKVEPIRCTRAPAASHDASEGIAGADHRRLAAHGRRRRVRRVRAHARAVELPRCRRISARRRRATRCSRTRQRAVHMANSAGRSPGVGLAAARAYLVHQRGEEGDRPERALR